MDKVHELSEENIVNTELFKELMDSTNTNDFEPYVEKNKVLMAPGVWNECYYSKESIMKAYKSTDWEDRYNSNLILDHKDNDFSEWVGDVRNKRCDSETGYVYGDLYVYDPVTAIKLKYGKPKTGISPKVTGEVKEKAMTDFIFNNFSIVINPAVKKAYINNGEGNKLVFFSEGGVRMSDEDKVDETNGNEAKEDAKENGAELSEVQKFNEFATGFIKENAEASLSDIYAAYVKENAEDEPEADKEEKKKPEDDESTENAEDEEDLPEDKKKKEDEDEPESDEEMTEVKKEMKTMSSTIKELNKKIKFLEEPVRATSSGVVADLSSTKDSDEQMLSFLQGI